eukprot:gene23285-30521_t
MVLGWVLRWTSASISESVSVRWYHAVLLVIPNLQFGFLGYVLFPVFCTMKLCIAALILLVIGQAYAVEIQPTPTHVVDLILKKDYDAFVEEMGGATADPNQPDTKGRLPMIEAVKTKQVKFVDALFQFFAVAQVKEPTTGSSPIHYAFKAGLVDISKMLLAYGADLNVTDKSGRKAREFTPAPALKELVKLWDDKGAMSFEDAPGTWVKSKNDKDDTYWFNVKTGEARWNMPPSCAWQRVLYQGHPSHYVNQVTGQTVATIPPALSWRKVKQEGDEPMWYNWALNTSQLEAPDELPDELLTELEAPDELPEELLAELEAPDEVPEELLTAAQESIFNVRWYNEKTQEFAWVDPKYHTPWREIKNEEGKTYFYNVESGDTQWETPDEMAWTKSDEHPGEFFYHNQNTKESMWEKPHTQAWEIHTHDFKKPEKDL